MGEAESPSDPQNAAGRAQFGSRIGFILAAIGSAVGFGSIARFPMNVANNGGAIFVIIYALLMVLVGIPIMVSELSMGRAAQRNTVGVYKHLTGKPFTGWRAAGYFHFLLAAFFLSWYAVVCGWTLRYAMASITGDYFLDADAYKGDAEFGPDALFWHFVVLILTLAAVISIISKGIEKVNLVLMPALFVMIFGLAIYATTLSGVFEGYTFYLSPDLSALSLGTISTATGQALFSLSLGQGAMMTYASYLPRTTSLASNAMMISGSTLAFALMCGFMIFPLLASFGDLEGAKNASGLALILGPLAKTFAAMGSPLGNIVGVVFFLATFFAGYTSAISLTEPAIAWMTEELNVDRRRAAILVVTAIYAVGIVPAFSITTLGIWGGSVTDVAVIAGALVIALYVGWFSPAAVARARMDESDSGIRLGRFIHPWVKFVIPVVLAALLFFAVTGTPCLLSNDLPGPGLLQLTGFQGWACTGT